MEPTYQKFRYLDIFSTLFVASLLSANIVAVKIIHVSGLFLPAGTIVFPISYIINDVLTEIYGLRLTKRVIWLGFLANLFLVLVIMIAQILPGAPFWDAQAAYERILGFAPKLLLGSFLGYLAGSFANTYIMSWMKTLTKGHWLWSRTISSTIVGEGLDTWIFVLLAFGGTINRNDIIQAALTTWIFKSLYEILITPLTYFIISYVRLHENI